MEEVIRVQGGHDLSGTLTAHGAKNSALKLMAASVIAQGVSIIHNVPVISDVFVMSDVLRALGAKVEQRGHTVIIDTADLDSYHTPYELVAKMRASISILGPLISRFGKAVVAMPGGCQIGSRKIDQHIVGLEALGVEFDFEHGNISASTPHGLRGADITLNFPSVGATENLMMAGISAKGRTTIDNAAREPEIVDLAEMLNKMGARIQGQGTPVIEIDGVDGFHPTEHTTVGDRIEAGTFLVAGALCHGPLTVEEVDPAHLTVALSKLEAMGVTVERGERSITVLREGDLKPIDIQTLPHPGFPTDLQAQYMVLCSIAKGNSVITENLFENRFMFAGELSRMGGDIRIESHHALVMGVDHLSAAPVESPDLRGGAALVLAGLIADGETVVSHLSHIDRGYEDFVGCLASVGARISRTGLS